MHHKKKHHKRISCNTLVKTMLAYLTMKHCLLRQNITERNIYFYTSAMKN